MNVILPSGSAGKALACATTCPSPETIQSWLLQPEAHLWSTCCSPALLWAQCTIIKCSKSILFLMSPENCKQTEGLLVLSLCLASPHWRVGIGYITLYYPEPSHLDPSVNQMFSKLQMLPRHSWRNSYQILLYCTPSRLTPFLIL